MSERIRALALTGLITGLIVICLYLEAVVPTGRAGFLVLASFLMCSLFLSHRWRWALGGFAASLLLSFILVPDKLGLFPYALLFGPYPLLKNLVEQLGRFWLEWLVKLAGFGMLLLAGYGLFQGLLPVAALASGYKVIAAGLLVIGFVVYDILLSQWVRFFVTRIAPHMRRNRR